MVEVGVSGLLGVFKVDVAFLLGGALERGTPAILRVCVGEILGFGPWFWPVTDDFSKSELQYYIQNALEEYWFRFFVVLPF